VEQQALAALELPLPPLVMQQAFTDYMAAIDAHTALLQRSANRLDGLLGTLRDRAFRGTLVLA
jgi:restriction endonuclease S subunit